MSFADQRRKTWNGFSLSFSDACCGLLKVSPMIPDRLAAANSTAVTTPSEFGSEITPATYTAIVRGVNGTTGIAVVEVYALSN